MFRSVLIIFILLATFSPLTFASITNGVDKQEQVFNPSSERYHRADWRHWIDEDGDCQDTRQEVLIRDSRSAVKLSEDGCRVILGEWVDPYNGEIIDNPSLVDIDHVVPLREAHLSGGASWSDVKKQAYANWMMGLVATGRSSNRSKGTRDPSEWMPEISRCWYSVMWVTVKAFWELEIDYVEHKSLVGACFR